MRHLADGERLTFRVMMAGQDVPRLVGMIEEYARHLGQADLLRERIDGRIGQ